MGSLTSRIQARLDDLSPAEKRVGDWLLADLPRAVDASLAAVAAGAGVSEPTVIRFCRRLSLAGFRDLRTRLIADAQRPDSYLHRDVGSTDTVAEASTKVIDSSVRALVDVRSLVAEMPFGRAAHSLASARQVIFVGMGASGIVAEDARHKFFRLGLPSSTATDSQTIMQQAAVATRDDVFIAISHTGQWPELVSAMKLADSRGALVIALTDSRSPLASVASILFVCHPREDTSVFTPMTSRLVQLALLDSLQVALALEMGDTARENLRRSKETLAALRAHWETTEID